MVGVACRILLSIDRSQSVADAMDSVLLAETYSKSSSRSNVKVVGVDLSGNPYVCVHVYMCVCTCMYVFLVCMHVCLLASK